MGGPVVKRNITSIVLCLILILSSFFILDFKLDYVEVVKGETFYVNTTGDGGAFTSIQDAINASSDGDTVFVYEGTYYENLVINKTINLVGENRNNTIIDSDRKGDAMQVTADWVNITRIMVTGGTASSQNGIELNYVHNCSIVDIKASNNQVGVRIYYSNNNTIINNNLSDNNRGGVFLHTSDFNNVTGNNASSNGWNGIELYSSKGNSIVDNIVKDNFWGALVLQWKSDNNSIIGNVATNDNSYGIYIDESSGNRIIQNQMSKMGRSIYFHHSHRNIVFENDVSGSVYGLMLSSAHENYIENNIVSACTRNGIHLHNSNANNIAGNDASMNTDYGIIFDYFCDRNIVEGNIVLGNEHGIYVRQSNDNNIKDNNVSYNSDGIFVHSSTGNNISNNNIYSNSKLGIYLELAEKNDINGNNVSSNNRGGIWFEDSPSNNISRNNIFSNNYNGIYLYESDSINITGNYVSSNERYGIIIWSSKLNTLRNNSIVKNGIAIEGTMLVYWNTHDIDTSNTVNGKPVYYWKNLMGGIIPPGAGQVILANCTNIKIENQELTYSSIGIELGFSSNINITGNNVSSNRYFAIYLYSSSGNNVINNRASKSEFGIFLHGFYESSNRNDIVGNSFNSNNQYGIEIYSGRDNNITGNNASYNIHCGIHLLYATKNSVINNNVSNNGIGISVASTCYSNKIFHNNIIDNLDQAFDHTSNDNIWDNGYPFGGNYWSDYNGEDKFKGPNQDQPGDDGIGDIPYLIDSNSQDNYPLIKSYSYKPLENYTILKSGWNLISVPLIQKEKDLTKVLEMIDGYYDVVQWHNSIDQGDPWKHNKVNKPYGNDLYELNETMGFWILITNPGDTIFLYNGTQSTQNQTILLHKGWNMVGYPSQINYNRKDGLNNLTFGTDVDAIWSYNASTQKWIEMGDSDYFEMGRGYYIHAKTKCEWEVPL
jgi:parallel beta-helix repeat protein